MKTRINLLAFAFLASLQVSFAGDTVVIEQSNYVVIGAFSLESNAVKFAEKASKNRFHAEFAINQRSNLYYVYVINTGNY